MTRILILNDYQEGDKEASGAERFITILSKSLQDLGVDTEIATFFPRNPGEKILSKFDYIHVNNYRGASTDTQASLLALKDKTFFTVHDYMYLCKRRNILTDEGFICPFLAEYDVCEECVVDDNPIVDGFLNHFKLIFPSHNMERIYNEISPFESTAIHHGIEVPDDDEVSDEDKGLGETFLFTGRVLNEKGVYELLAAFRSVQSVYPEAKLVLSNLGNDMHKVCAIIERMGLEKNIDLLNRVPRPQLEREYDKSMCLIAPSVWEEPFNFTVLEAYAHRRPVLASAMGAHPETVQHGKTGLLHGPFEAKELEDNMFWVLENKEKTAEMGRNGFSALKERFDVRDMAKNYVSFIEGMQP